MPPDDWSRRDVHRALLGTLVAGCAPRGSATGDTDVLTDTDGPAASGRPRAVILITADDLGWKDVGAYGLDLVATPALDRLVAEGATFDRAFDVTSTCSSSRATYATGQYPHTHGVTGLVHRHPELSLPSSRPHLARSFQDAGWATALQGKWHLSQTEQPQAFGYDEHLPTEVDQLIRTSDAARAFLEQHRDGGFFLELNFMQTHRIPLVETLPQEPGFEVDEGIASPPAWWGLPDLPAVRTEVAGYMSRLAWMDALIGEVLDALDDLGLADDTLVAFVSDNGPPFAGLKLTLYDRGTGTPLMFRWPAGLTPQRTDALWSSVDLAPTLLDLAGLPPLEGAQGRSWRPFLEEGGPFALPEAIFSEMEQHGGPLPARAVRTATHKYVVNLSDKPWGGAGQGWKDEVMDLPGQTWDEPRPREELYDLTADPLERTNLVDDPGSSAVLADLRARLAAHLAASEDPRAGDVAARQAG
ncbi:MAG: sulfatase [Alphaproteobacteria bacterium]|nr:sulfatase [Alphaproteobacteria bacterium]